MSPVNISTTHPWDLRPKEARELQQVLAQKVVREGRIEAPRYVAGIDVGFEARNTITRAAVVVLDYEDLHILTHAVAQRPTTFPYIPGLLSFREVPAVLDALQQLDITPDVLLCDGQGIAHPRRFGIASHIGVLTGIPAIGVAKKRLIGEYTPPPQTKGAWEPLLDDDECIGAVLRTRVNTHPLFISIGHRISLPDAIAMVMHCITRYRLPETTRAAHHLASEIKGG